VRSYVFSPKLLSASVCMTLLIGCAPISSLQRSAPADNPAFRANQVLINQATNAYLEGSVSYWDWFRTPEIRQTVQPPAVTQPLNIDSNLKAKALAGTLQAKLEISPKVAINIAPLIEKSAETHQVPSSLIAAVVNAESEFRSGRRSPAGAVGLAQVLPRVWGKQCNLKTDAGNIDCGAKILAHYYELSGSWGKALAYYNVGPGKYERSRAARKTGHRYASTVLASMQQIKAGREKLIRESIQEI